MLCCLLAYDAAGNIVATLDHVVARDPDGNVLGLVDFAAHEEAGGENTAIWTVSNATGSKVWPEWLGSRAHDFTVELEGPPGRKRIAKLIHKTSGHERTRKDIEDAIAARIDKAKKDNPDRPVADIRDIVGGPDRPLELTSNGTNKRRVAARALSLPVAFAGQRTEDDAK